MRCTRNLSQNSSSSGRNPSKLSSSNLVGGNGEGKGTRGSSAGNGCETGGCGPGVGLFGMAFEDEDERLRPRREGFRPRSDRGE